MPLHYNEYNQTPKDAPVESVHTDADGASPHGPGNRVNFDFAPVGPGNPKYLTGPPLAEMNAIPYRGAGMAAHGMDIDDRTLDWENHASPQEGDAGNDGQDFAEWVAPMPLLVSVVDMPLETSEKQSRIVPMFGANETYTFTTLGALDNNPVRTLLPKDDTRKAATLYACPTPQYAAASGNGAQYAFLISNDQQCLTGVLLGTSVANSPWNIRIDGKSPVFGRLVPLAAYDATKTNNFTLVAVTETAILGLKRTN